MELKVKIPDGIAALAKERGVRVEEYVESILAEQLGNRAGNGGSRTERPKSPEEIRTWLDSLAQFSDKIPPLPDTITRDWIYQEHE
jgi:hypothetical protein